MNWLNVKATAFGTINRAEITITAEAESFDAAAIMQSTSCVIDRPYLGFQPGVVRFLNWDSDRLIGGNFSVRLHLELRAMGPDAERNGASRIYSRDSASWLPDVPLEWKEANQWMA